MKQRKHRFNDQWLATIPVMLLVFFVTGCELFFPPRTKEQTVNLQQYVAHPSEATIMIGSSESADSILDYDDSTGTISIPLDNYDPDIHLAGKIILAGISPMAPEGILREITGIVVLENENRVPLQTSEADLETAFDTLQISFRRYLTEEEILSADYSQGVRLIGIVPDKRALLNNTENRSISGSPLSVRLEVGAGIEVNDKVSLRIDGGIVFTPALEIEIDIQPGKEPSILFALRGYTELEANATVELTQEFVNAELLQVSYTLMQVPLTPIMIGVVPIVHDIKLLAEFTGEARAGVTGGFRYSSMFRGGAILAGGNVRLISEHRGDFLPIGPTLKGEVSVKAALAPVYSMYMFGSGPKMKMAPYAKLSATVLHAPGLDSTDLDVTGSLTAGLEAKVSGSLVFLRRTLAALDYTVFDINAGALWSGEVTVPLSPVNTPTISPASGGYTDVQTVSIACTTAGSIIRYTVNGTDPTSTTGLLYSGPFSVSAPNTTIKARAYKSFHAPSTVANRQYQITITTGTPTFNPPTGTYGSIQNVMISSPTSGATIRYTTNGTTPSQTNGTLYSGAITIDATTTLKAIAYKNGIADSMIQSGTYIINLPQIESTQFSIAPGTYTSIQNVELLSPTSGATIRYTTNGTTPSQTNGSIYTGPITIATTSTIKAIAYKYGMSDSPITSGTYILNLPQVEIPAFSPTPGTYTSSQSVTITTMTSGATIRYTTNGTSPSKTYGTIYSGSITVSSSALLQAIAYKDGMRDSSVQSGSYTINLPQVSSPVFSPSPGVYSSTQTISMSTTTSGATIRYTINGSSPTPSSGTFYSGPINISSTSTIQAIAYKAGMTNSAIQTGVYTIAATGTVTGTVVNATTGAGLANVLVSVQSTPSYSTTTGTNGSFSLTAPIGAQTLVFTLAGYVIPSLQVSVNTGQNTTIPGSTLTASQSVPAGNIRLVLTWGAAPPDLDAHLLTPNGHHISFSNQEPPGALALLDVDDTSGYGPETVTITSVQTGTYVFYVHRYSSTGSLAGSGARVQVFNSSGLMQTLTVPSSGTGDYWRVLTIENSLVNVQNQITSTEPTLPSAAALTLSQSSGSHSASSGSGSVSVSSNVSWTASSSASWITMTSGTSGSGNGTIGYTVSANTSTSSRSGSITVSGGGLTRTFSITQSGSTASTRSVDITFVAGYNSSETSWSISQSGTTVASGTGSGLSYGASTTITRNLAIGSYTLAGHDSYGDGWEGGYLIVKYTGGSTIVSSFTLPTGFNGSTTFSVSAGGTATPSLVISPTSGTHSASSGSGSFSVSSNVSWTAGSSASWITMTSGTSGSGNGTIGYTVASNTSTSSRSGSITVGGGGITRTFSISQSGATLATRSVDITFVAGGWAYESSWSISQGGTTVASGSGNGMSSGTSSTITRNLTTGTYTITGHDSYGDGWNGAYLTIRYSAGSTIVSSFTFSTGSSASTTFTVY